MSRTIRAIILLVALALAGAAYAQQRFPPPDFTTDYHQPALTMPAPRAAWADWLDVGLLVAAMMLAAYIALKLRRRWAMTTLSVACLAYFGFYRAGCVCPIGAIQNVSQGAFDSGFYLPWTVIAFFTLPLLVSLVFGRVFCGGVCWLGAMQDLVLIRPVAVPRWLQKPLRVLPWIYLGAAVMFAATGAMWIICDWDPFVPFFRMAGPAFMFGIGGGMLLLSTFIGRPYCRFLCPYGALLGLLSRASWKGVAITPDECVNCSLCRDACPFSAIVPSNTRKDEEDHA